jgi:uncharacterized protein YdcH (DUF465 family)
MAHRSHRTEFKEMKWTPEREAWFASLFDALNKLGAQIESGLAGRPDVLARKIEQKLNLLT